MHRWILLLLTVLLATAEGSLCRKTKWAINCYHSCARIPVVDATYCDCDVRNSSFSSLNSSSVPLRVETANEVPQATAVYKDVRTISITLGPSQKAFIYMFEFSSVSSKPNSWFYGGSSITPSITFTIPDPCIDYQFRVYALMPVFGNDYQLIAYRPRAIPVELPPFSLKPEQIRMEKIIYNRDNRSINVYINWKNPRGYTENDISGYESPAVYPIQCLSPEDQLPTPVIETFSKGGRLKLTLPIEMLEEKCRLWFEVRMLPTCDRIEPFMIQETVELNCNYLPTIDICRHSLPPQCTEIVDVWGYGNDVTLMWAPPPGNHRPLYYNIRYGPAEMHGTEPFLSWMITSETDLKVDGDTNVAKIAVKENMNYGTQICAVYDEENSNIKYGLVKVIPFLCSSCAADSPKTLGRCSECSKIENPNSIVRRCHPKGGIGCANEQHMKPQSESSSRSSIEEPSEIFSEEERILSLNKSIRNNDDVVPSLSSNKALTSDIENAIETMLGTELKLSNEQTSEKTFFERTSQNSAFFALTTISTVGALSDTTDTNVEKTEEVNYEDRIPDIYEITTPNLTPVPLFSNDTINIPPMEGVTAILAVTPKKIVPMLKNRTEGLPETEKHFTEAFTIRKTIVETSPSSLVGHKSGGETSNEDVSNTLKSREIRMHQKSMQAKKACLLRNGIVCEYGCETSKKCFCPDATHLVVSTGECILNSKRSDPASTCLRMSDVNATWDSQLMLLKLYSRELYNEVKANSMINKVYLEFGKVSSTRLLMGKKKQKIQLNGYYFVDDKRYKVVVEAEEIIRQKFFMEKAFPFYLNQEITPITSTYGMRICTYNSSQVPKPYSKNWDLELKHDSYGEQLPNETQVLQLSPVYFQTVTQAAFMSPTGFSRFFFTIPIALIIILMILIIFVLFFNCSKLRHLYGRRKTKYYQTYIVNSSNPYKYRNKLTSQNGFVISATHY